jgi:hypothetical protein
LSFFTQCSQCSNMCLNTCSNTNCFCSHHVEHGKVLLDLFGGFNLFVVNEAIELENVHLTHRTCSLFKEPLVNTAFVELMFTWQDPYNISHSVVFDANCKQKQWMVYIIYFLLYQDWKSRGNTFPMWDIHFSLTKKPEDL